MAEIKDGKFEFTKVKKNTTADDIGDITSHIVVATIQSLSARLRDDRTKDKLLYWLRNVCKFVMVDECQAVGTTTWEEVLNECKAPYRICLSATPNRTDGGKIKINSQSGPLLFSTTAEEQIKKGRLCDLRIHYIVYNHGLYNEKDADIQYQDAYRDWIVENEARNNLIVDNAVRMVNEGRFVLILISYIEHGYVLKDLLMTQGLHEEDIRFIFGSTANEARKNAISEFKKGAFKILIGSTIFDAGVNIPAISGVILAGAGNSEISLIQRIGRGARNVDYEEVLGYLPEFMLKNNGQKVTEVVDFFDDNVKFFKNQSWNRYKIAKEEFGSDRVSISGKIENKKSITIKNKISLSESDEAKKKMIQEFLNSEANNNHEEMDSSISNFIKTFQK